MANSPYRCPGLDRAGAAVPAEHGGLPDRHPDLSHLHYIQRAALMSVEEMRDTKKEKLLSASRVRDAMEEAKAATDQIRTR
jgi:hypothetical protein